MEDSLSENPMPITGIGMLSGKGLDVTEEVEDATADDM